MKKVLLTAVAVFAFSFANAQEVKFGAKAGLNMSSLKSSGFGDTKSLVGFHIGGLAEIKLNDKMSIQPELLYSQEGGKYEFTDNIFGTVLIYNQEIKLSKINIPVSFKYYVIERLSIEAGPQFDFILKAKSEANANLPEFSSKLENNTDLSNSTSVATYIDTTDGSVQ
uniref:porin family protein n=1 Tax=Flavobacterium sp. TaxID=239 RepID=UPI00374D65C7